MVKKRENKKRCMCERREKRKRERESKRVSGGEKVCAREREEN